MEVDFDDFEEDAAWETTRLLVVLGAWVFGAETARDDVEVDDVVAVGAEVGFPED